MSSSVSSSSSSSEPVEVKEISESQTPSNESNSIITSEEVQMESMERDENEENIENGINGDEESNESNESNENKEKEESKEQQTETTVMMTTEKPAPPKKPPTSAYFMFCSEHRPELMRKNPGKKASDYAKLLSVEWKELNVEKKNELQEKLTKLKNEYNIALTNYESKYGKVVSKKKKENGSKMVTFPLAKVKQIIEQDDRVKRVSKETVILITKCAEKFVSEIAQCSQMYAKEDKKKSILERHVLTAIHSIPQFDFLRRNFPMDSPIKKARKRKQRDQKSKPAKKQKTAHKQSPQSAVTPNNSSIINHFQRIESPSSSTQPQQQQQN